MAEVDLVGDLGGTNLRLALVDSSGRPSQVQIYQCADYPGLQHTIEAYRDSVGNPALRRAAIAVATPVSGDLVTMTNSPWRFSIEQTRTHLGLTELRVLNDFTAVALSLPLIESEHLLQVGAGRAVDFAAKGVLGPGTGLGVSGLVHSGQRWIALASEGGHTSFSPGDAEEIEILRWTWQRYPHVSTERLVAGIGWSLLHEAICAVRGLTYHPMDPATIGRLALAGTDPSAVATLNAFCGILGTAAGNLAMTLGARGGIYLAGGIAARYASFLASSQFRARFEAKGRFAGYNAEIPTWVITGGQPGLLGAAASLQQA